MIEFTIDKKEYKIGDLTIRDYYRIQHMFVQDTVNSQINIIAELSDCPFSELRKLDKLQFVTLWNEVVDDKLNVPNDTPFHKSFVFKDTAYCFLDIDHLTIGEFADMEVLRTDPNHQRNLHKMMAVLYRPAIVIKSKQYAEPYDSVSLTDRSEEFMDLPLLYVYSALNFFLQIPRSLCEITLTSLITPEMTNLEKKQIKEMNQTILELLDLGTERSSSAPEKILQKSIKLKELALSLSSTGSLSKKIDTGNKKTFLGRLTYGIKQEVNRRLQNKANSNGNNISTI